MKGFNAIKNLFSKQTFLFKKYIFLPFDSEKHDFKHDYVRLKLIAFQVLEDIQNSKYYLSFHDYCLFASFNLYFKVPHVVEYRSVKKADRWS